MAKIKSALFTKASGSINGMTLSHNRGGMYIKAQSNPVNPNTPQQQTVRTIFADLANRWGNTLTQAQRDKWGDYAANVSVVDTLGDDIFLTGFNMYIRANSPREQSTSVGLTLPRVDDGPIIFNLGSFTAVTMVASAAANSLAITFAEADDWVGEDDAAMMLWSARPQSPTIDFFKGPYRFSGDILGDAVTPPTTPASIAAQFPFDVGQKVFARVRVTRVDGRLSADQRISAIAVA